MFYNNHVTYRKVRTEIQEAFGKYDELLIEWNLRWVGFIIRFSGYTKTSLHRKNEKKKKRFRQKKR